MLWKDACEIIISQPSKSSRKYPNPIELTRIHNAIRKNSLTLLWISKNKINILSKCHEILAYLIKTFSQNYSSLKAFWKVEYSNKKRKYCQGSHANHNLHHGASPIPKLWHKTCAIRKDSFLFNFIAHAKRKENMGNEREKNILVLGIKDKRKIMTLISSLTNGNFLPLQIIFMGSTIRCLLPRTIGKVFCLMISFHLMYSANHWSTLEIWQQFVERILIPYMKDQMQELILPKAQKMSWLLNFYYIHKSLEFIN